MHVHPYSATLFRRVSYAMLAGQVRHSRESVIAARERMTKSNYRDDGWVQCFSRDRFRYAPHGVPQRSLAARILAGSGLWCSADSKVFHLGARVISSAQRFGHRHGCKQMRQRTMGNVSRHRVKQGHAPLCSCAASVVKRNHPSNDVSGSEEATGKRARVLYTGMCALLTAVAALGAEDRDGVQIISLNRLNRPLEHQQTGALAHRTDDVPHDPCVLQGIVTRIRAAASAVQRLGVDVELRAELPQGSFS